MDELDELDDDDRPPRVGYIDPEREGRLARYDTTRAGDDTRGSSVVQIDDDDDADLGAHARHQGRLWASEEESDGAAPSLSRERDVYDVDDVDDVDDDECVHDVDDGRARSPERFASRARGRRTARPSVGRIASSRRVFFFFFWGAHRAASWDGGGDVEGGGGVARRHVAPRAPQLTVAHRARSEGPRHSRATRRDSLARLFLFLFLFLFAQQDVVVAPRPRRRGDFSKAPGRRRGSVVGGRFWIDAAWRWRRATR